MRVDTNLESGHGEQNGTEHDSIIQTAEFKQLVELDAELFGTGEPHDDEDL